MLMNSLKLAKFGVSGISSEDGPQAAAIATLVEYITGNRLRSEIRREVELYCQYGNQYGWSAMHIGWDQQTGLREQTINISQIVDMATAAQQQGQDSLTAGLPQYIMNPESEDFAVSLLAE